MTSPDNDRDYLVCAYCRTASAPGPGRLTCPSCGAPLPPRAPRPPEPPRSGPARSGWPFALFVLLPITALAHTGLIFLGLASFGLALEYTENQGRYRSGAAGIDAGAYEETLPAREETTAGETRTPAAGRSDSQPQ